MSKTALFEVFVGHRVIDVGPVTTPSPDVTGAISAGQLTYFLEAQSTRRALALKDIEHVRPSAVPPYLLTFDDGFKDFATVALPILEKHNTPALLFVTTGWIGGAEAPYEYVLGELLSRAGESLELGGERALTRTEAERLAVYNQLRLSVKKASPVARMALLRLVADAVGARLEEINTSPILSAEELRSLDQHELVTLGAHSVQHLVLSSCSPTEAWAEIRGSALALESLLGHPVTAFAYPYGAQTLATRALARLAGFRWAFTTRQAPVRHLSAIRRLCLPRWDLAAWGEGA